MYYYEALCYFLGGFTVVNCGRQNSVSSSDYKSENYAYMVKKEYCEAYWTVFVVIVFSI